MLHCDDEEDERNTLRIPFAVSDLRGEEFVDNYEMLDSVNDEYLLRKKMVHYVDGHIMPEHWVACKVTLGFHAGSATSKLAPTT